MAKVILFDLDGTLLPMDTEQFVHNYLQVLAKKVSSCIDSAIFIKALWAATEAMITNLDPDKSNEQVFTETFLKLTQLNKEEIWPVFDEFYSQVFPTLSHLCQPTPLAARVVEEALQQGYRVAVATNPVFPRQAILHRLTWAGVDHIPFELVTVYEECCFTKPHRHYYEWICETLRVQPEQCIMVGNDMQEDMSASQAGMKTFLVEGYVIDRGQPQYRVDDRGTLADLYEKLKERKGLFTPATFGN
ncbi:HAD-superfamily hydrolase, subfamily IA, variant 1 [Caldalkalibacillus thermarum TA2.A1]|uniref:HAD family hydrolase n=1 Tax=Caldalkalibacillus thermarum (strain TA2.A1) TaxID=986075 RepID=F5L772_CALTT|nr:HAD family hydrolase [Caldalkalibacillus thermarum]EGL82793.1 HAD-superfamily hydrolase, subfamily IA, variant 1 [Caldalkalibacillus thermarum TA2.A1]QZT34768.1 HAD family hydrolase [Caldalkalibacillus thermarum TA2.A1]